MSTLEAIWLGIVQGLTEFFPVSSSGHLVLFQRVLGIEMHDLVFDVAVHVATLVAILLYYHAKVRELLLGLVERRSEAIRYTGKLAVATLPAAVVGLSAQDLVVEQASAPPVVGAMLLLTGCIVWTTRKTWREAGLAEPTWSGAVLIGLAQAVAILPGVSRSGSTVAAALAVGVEPVAAAEFSFLLGVIAITGAAILVLPGLRHAGAGELEAIGIGVCAALVSGLLAIWLFVRMLRSHTFHRFAWWAWGAGASFLTWYLLRA
jgi:undecaprenyl-diphosphatase